MKDLEKLLKNKFNLQLFADGDAPEGGEGNNDGDAPEGGEGQNSEKNTKKYSDEDVNKIIVKKFAEWEKKQEKKTKENQEAERLKNMSEQEKRDHEFKELQAKIANYEKQEALGKMTKVARSILSEQEINVNDELLSNLVTEDADTTKTNVENFAKMFKAAVQKEVATKLRHEPPKKGSGAKLTKEDILKVQNRAERQKLIKEHMSLFK
nr:MAG TPA: capsid scaffolding protein [Caudoviricetes sp.]